MTTKDFVAALARYRKIVATFSDLEVKGKANPYTSMNGNMFSFLDKTGVLCLRLSEVERTALPERVASDPGLVHTYFKKSVAYAASLPAKATKRR